MKFMRCPYLNVSFYSVEVDTNRVKEDWLETEGQFQIKNIAQHYGIYEHLFGFAYFIPRITLDIKVKFTHVFKALKMLQ